MAIANFPLKFLTIYEIIRRRFSQKLDLDRNRRNHASCSTSTGEYGKITITKTVFDDLVSVAEVASRVQHFFRPTEMTITHQNGEYHVAVRDAVIPAFTVSKPTLLEALSEDQRQNAVEIEKFIR